MQIAHGGYLRWSRRPAHPCSRAELLIPFLDRLYSMTLKVYCRMPWDVILLSEVADWYGSFDNATAALSTAAVDLLAESGPTLGRPLVDTLRWSELAHPKKLRPGSVGRSEIRVLFAFDPRRQAILLAAGEKAGRWKD